MATFVLCYHSMAPCTCNGTSVLVLFVIFRDLFLVLINRRPFAALVVYSIALYSALLHRRMEGR